MNGGLTQVLRLVDLAFSAERAGDPDTADRFFAEAERIGSAELATTLEEEHFTIIEQYWHNAHGIDPDREIRGWK